MYCSFCKFKIRFRKDNLQKKVKINKNDNLKSLAKKILKQEHNLYPKAIIKNFILIFEKKIDFYFCIFNTI